MTGRRHMPAVVCYKNSMPTTRIAVMAFVASIGLGGAPESWFPDGDRFTYITLKNSGDYDIWSFSLRERAATALVALEGTPQLSSRVSPDGRELYFDHDGALHVVSIQTSPRVSAGPPRRLPIAGFIQGFGRRTYDLAPDGRFFLMLTR